MVTNNKKILVIVGGPERKIGGFSAAGKKLDLEVTTASFSDIEFLSNGEFVLKVKGHDIAEFDVLYIRMVGKRLEEATLVANYAKEKGVRIADRLYGESLLLPMSLGKAVETKLLIQGGIPIPKTFFGSLKKIQEVAPRMFGFPFVLKSTTGKKARDVWSPKNHEELEELVRTLKTREREGTRFFAQEFIAGSQRMRVFVLGGRAIAAITRPTKWRKRFLEKAGGEYPEGEKRSIDPIPKEDAELAIAASSAVGLDISGVDILHDDKTRKPYVLEVNSAPAWEAVRRDTGLAVEEEILKFLRDL